jgi:pSer/pThr/pTyr-binding forkhead associated (FHA) protein
MSTFRLQRPGEPPREITQDKALVGRDASCDVVVADKSVSRRHALLERRGEAWAVVDQGSANGTFLDGKPISASALRDGQELRFGMVSFRVEIEADMPTMLMPARRRVPPARPAAPVAPACLCPGGTGSTPASAAPRAASPPPASPAGR